MSANTFPEDMVSGSSWAEQVGSGYLMANPMNAMSAVTQAAMFWPMATMGAMTGAWLASLEMMGLRDVAKAYGTFLDMKGTAARTPAATSRTTASAKSSRPAAATKVKTAAPKTSAKPAASERLAKGRSRPAGLEAPRGGKADDLKTISGIGPKLEVVLNDLGIYHFDQIASWTKGEIEWVDDYLKFKGRIARDGWIKQASDLAGAA